ncbi:unnamed protein product [Trichogramma brassicae]|uniref:Mutator-like transposase domain-containing protein n=1 Tax=Trichogramma brassicae TaxID=86971 RepID=A0A6H5ITA7_9HYME|nr:unnamed protein product [Trichogramma brassicae]
MKEAGAAEKEYAIRNGQLHEHKGELIPWIAITADGSWMTRSYGTKYNSTAGLCVIVGMYTGRVLFVGVRNKYCAACAYAERNDIQPKIHDCFKNYDNNAPSSGMESDALLEGFKQSFTMHGVLYKEMIADGDANAFKRLDDNNVYSDFGLRPTRIRCYNHLQRNLYNQLENITKIVTPAGCTRNEFIPLRKKIAASVGTFRKLVSKCVDIRRSQNDGRENKIIGLRKDLLNLPNHIFGDHENCAELSYDCPEIVKGKESTEKNYVPDMKNGDHFFNRSSVASRQQHLRRPKLHEINPMNKADLGPSTSTASHMINSGQRVTDDDKVFNMKLDKSVSELDMTDPKKYCHSSQIWLGSEESLFWLALLQLLCERQVDYRTASTSSSSNLNLSCTKLKSAFMRLLFKMLLMVLDMKWKLHFEKFAETSSRMNAIDFKCQICAQDPLPSSKPCTPEDITPQTTALQRGNDYQKIRPPMYELEIYAACAERCTARHALGKLIYIHTQRSAAGRTLHSYIRVPGTRAYEVSAANSSSSAYCAQDRIHTHTHTHTHTQEMASHELARWSASALLDIKYTVERAINLILYTESSSSSSSSNPHTSSALPYRDGGGGARRRYNAGARARAHTYPSCALRVACSSYICNFPRVRALTDRSRLSTAAAVREEIFFRSRNSPTVARATTIDTFDELLSLLQLLPFVGSRAKAHKRVTSNKCNAKTTCRAIKVVYSHWIGGVPINVRPKRSRLPGKHLHDGLQQKIKKQPRHGDDVRVKCLRCTTIYI